MDIVKMEPKHIDGVMVVEHLSFTVPWSRESFTQELMTNGFAHYIAAIENDVVIGYAGMWKIEDEGHITNVAVHPEFRGTHIGKKLMEALIKLAKDSGIRAMTLEVRKSNYIALNLYKSLGFTEAGIRKNYYSDNREDAIIMWNEQI